jgi:tetratricopeptide (TPR) repeat protein
MMQGDVAAARASRRRAELLQLEDGQNLLYPGTNAHYEALALWYTQDLITIKGITERLAAIAQDFPGWIPLMHASRSHYLRLRGDATAALATLEPALRDTLPGRHRHWAWVAGAHVQALDALGRHAEAVSHGLEYLAICERERLAPNHRGVALPLIEALRASGRVDDAEALADRCIEEIEASGVTGLARGAAYEARARVAIARRDSAAFERWAECCAQVYQRGHNPALRTKYEHLRRDADAAGLTDPEDLKATADWTSQIAQQEQARSAQTPLGPADPACAERALRVLLQAARAERGVLFGLRGGQLELIAAQPDPGLGDQLRQALWTYVEAELDAGRASDPAHDTPTAISPVPSFADAEGRRFEPVLLFTKRDGQAVLAAVAAVHRAGGRHGRLLPDADVMEALATALMENGPRGSSLPPAP